MHFASKHIFVHIHMKFILEQQSKSFGIQTNGLRHPLQKQKQQGLHKIKNKDTNLRNVVVSNGAGSDESMYQNFSS